MARHLLAAGHDLVGVDLDPGRVEALGAAGAASPAAAADGANLVITSLPDPASVKVVADEVVRAAPAGSLFVDMSTGPPALARELAAALGQAGIDSLDAPVSGGPVGATAATLTIMVGGSGPAFERARPALEALGRPFHIGGPGAGQTAKLCNNLIAGATMAALAESCAIAAAAQIEPSLLYELLITSTGDSRVLRSRFPLAGADAAHPSSNGYAPLFMLDLMAKDLELVLELGEAPVAAAALAAYRRAQEAGLGALDYSAVFLTSRTVHDPDPPGP